jgi:hypothetical protein
MILMIHEVIIVVRFTYNLETDMTSGFYYEVKELCFFT